MTGHYNAPSFFCPRKNFMFYNEIDDYLVNINYILEVFIMENNEAMVNDEQELNDVEVIDTDAVCEQDDFEGTETSLDGLSFALGSVATLLILKGIKKVVNSEPVQNKISEVKEKFAEQKERRLAAKEAKKNLKVVKSKQDVVDTEVVTEENNKAVNDK